MIEKGKEREEDGTQFEIERKKLRKFRMGRMGGTDVDRVSLGTAKPGKFIRQVARCSVNWIAVLCR